MLELSTTLLKTPAGSCRMLGDMTDLVGRLPDSYRRALALKDAGSTDAVIAAALDVAVESVAAILEIAAAKVEHIEPGRAGRQQHLDDGSRKGTCNDD